MGYRKEKSNMTERITPDPKKVPEVENAAQASTVEQRLTTISGNLAILFLEKNLRKGKTIEIPSLGIIIREEDFVVGQS
jgi:hypothetical protein